jgi:YHS domain-containing protein
MAETHHTDTAIDPVCGMTVQPGKARGGSFEYQGTTYDFCSPGCRETFAADPEGVLARGPAGMPSSSQPVMLHRSKPTHHTADASPAHAHHGETAIDPVCGMTVHPDKARGGSFEYQGTTYYFCSPGCREKFSADPEAFLARGPRGMAPTSHAHGHDAQADASPAGVVADAKARAAAMANPYTCPCTRRSSTTVPATARSAGWRSSRCASQPSRPTTANCAT